MALPSIILLAEGNNPRGDLLTRLTKDYFYALGYDDCRFNVARSGREVDVRASHRTEPRSLRAEAKARADPIGGSDVNKFVGVLDAESRESGTQVTGYFISLSGFTSTAVQQEHDFKEPRLILVTAEQLVSELSRSGVIVSPQRAVERVGRCLDNDDTTLMVASEPVLVGHELGWMWAVTYSIGKQPSHLSFVHADGEILAPEVAQRVLDMDRRLGGQLDGLHYIAPLPRHDAASTKDLESRYRKAVVSTYGTITLEGLPADESVGSKALRLDTIYVGTQLIQPRGEQAPQRGQLRFTEIDLETPGDDVATAGVVLGAHRHVAVLGLPGSGKSTFLKHLATRYASQSSGDDLDNLPPIDVLPFFIRCRQVQPRPDLNIVGLLSTLAETIEVPDPAGFDVLVRSSLAEGRALVLVDGLDELPDEALRVNFVKQLRIFMSTYPSVGLVMTSREAGFRAVAPAVAGACDVYRIADLNFSQIRALTLAWHREVVGPSAAIATSASDLAGAIWETDRVRSLAVNPLLLTTLLLVQRWAGELPRRRSVLYDKAIEVLLMTWNVEGHQPIEADEAIPQLCYLAFFMMTEGKKQISYDLLMDVLAEARREMPEVLGYAKVSTRMLVSRIEDRSSLLVQSGHSVEDGRLSSLYEFKHLTFQEFLAALAVVKGYFPNGTAASPPEETLSTHLGSPGWAEVIPLVAVLAGRRAGKVVEALVALCDAPSRVADERSVSVAARYGRHSYADLLCQCLIDEAQVSPELARTAIARVFRGWASERANRQMIGQLMSGRYGDLAVDVLDSLSRDSGPDISHVMRALSSYVDFRYGDKREAEGWSWQLALDLMGNDDRFKQVCGCLVAMQVAYSALYPSEPRHRNRRRRTRAAAASMNCLIDFLYSDSPEIQFAACWALAWSGSIGVLVEADISPSTLRRLVTFWKDGGDRDGQRMAAWAIAELPLLTERRPLGDGRGLRRFLATESKLSAVGEYSAFDRVRAAIIVGGYVGPLLDAERADTIAKQTMRRPDDRFISKLAVLYGD